MDTDTILNLLKQMADEKRKANLVKLGIPEENSLGVSTGDIRKLAKNYQKDELLARELWDTQVHEAKLLAVLLLTPKQATPEKIEYFMSEIYSWDLCDHFCKNYLVKTADYPQYIAQWVVDNRLYYKRAAFTLIASQVIKDKNISPEQLTEYLRYIELYSDDERVHVYKAVSWALRELGKVNVDIQEQAIIIAHQLCESSSKTQQKIGKLALKELENLVQVPGRTRLISADSKMAKL